jgi:sugar lactone lactonase YvrE
VSDGKGHILQVDSAGHALHDKRVACHILRGGHTLTEDGDLLFIDAENKVCKLTSDGTVTTLLTTDRSAYCIHSSRINGDILVGSRGRVTRYDRTGRELQVIEDRDRIRMRIYLYDWAEEEVQVNEWYDNRENLYELPWYITENKNGDIWTSDRYKDAVVVVDKSGRHRFDYKGRQSGRTGLHRFDRKSRHRFDYTDRHRFDYTIFGPNGICTNANGQVLVCDVWNNNVHLLDQDGNFLSLLLTRKQHGIFRPVALCVDDHHNLYLGQWHSNAIKVYKYQQDINVYKYQQDTEVYKKQDTEVYKKQDTDVYKKQDTDVCNKQQDTDVNPLVQKTKTCVVI